MSFRALRGVALLLEISGPSTNSECRRTRLMCAGSFATGSRVESGLADAGFVARRRFRDCDSVPLVLDGACRLALAPRFLMYRGFLDWVLEPIWWPLMVYVFVGVLYSLLLQTCVPQCHPLPLRGLDWAFGARRLAVLAADCLLNIFLALVEQRECRKWLADAGVVARRVFATLAPVSPGAWPHGVLQWWAC